MTHRQATIAPGAAWIGMNAQYRISGEGAGRAQADGAHRPVEIWLRHTLSRSYDDVLTEPLPDTWLHLVAAATPADRNE